MGLPDYSQYFINDSNPGPIIDPGLDFRPQRAYYLNSGFDLSQKARPETKQVPVEELKRVLVQETAQKMQIQIQDSHETIINFKPYFWFLLACVCLAPLLHNLINLTQNIGSTVSLNKERSRLTKDNQELVGKMQEYHSYSGMKRTIKEEIKVIERNEILIKIVK
jgi:hypothetical protein